MPIMGLNTEYGPRMGRASLSVSGMVRSEQMIAAQWKVVALGVNPIPIGPSHMVTLGGCLFNGGRDSKIF